MSSKWDKHVDKKWYYVEEADWYQHIIKWDVVEWDVTDNELAGFFNAESTVLVNADAAEVDETVTTPNGSVNAQANGSVNAQANGSMNAQANERKDLAVETYRISYEKSLADALQALAEALRDYANRS